MNMLALETTHPELPKVLVAEDNNVLGDVIRFNLLRAGCDVTLVRNGKEAREQLSTSIFDLLLTDFEMPHINGAELCRIAREELDLHSMAILLCSAKSLEIDHDRLKSKYSIASILAKPFSMSELTDLVLKLIAPAHGVQLSSFSKTVLSH